MIRAYIQARMGSSRFPGKVLAPLAGKPILAHVIERVGKALGLDRVVVATSSDRSDDPIAAYGRDLGVAVFRGALESVFLRFRACLDAHPCDAFFRICADSPLLDPSLFGRFLSVRTSDTDLVTNLFPRTFPKGRSLELVKADVFRSVDGSRLSHEQAEHVTGIFYDRPADFSIANVESGDPSLAQGNLCVDTLEDLRRLEELLASGGEIGERAEDVAGRAT